MPRLLDVMNTVFLLSLRVIFLGHIKPYQIVLWFGGNTSQPVDKVNGGKILTFWFLREILTFDYYITLAIPMFSY